MKKYTLLNIKVLNMIDYFKIYINKITSEVFKKIVKYFTLILD